MSSIANISGYKFITLANPSAWVDVMRQACSELCLRGTILISTEGWNIALAGEADAINEWCKWYNTLPEGQNTLFKTSYSSFIPFKKLSIRLKNEIIRMDTPAIDPTINTGKHLPPQVFKQWLDEGKSVTVLDTRNDYEFWFGHFENAIHFNIQHFTQFPEKLVELRDIDRQQPIVTYCTGGIRCEKATSFMQQAGFSQVYQLEGGILHYFEQCGSSHYEGECFVFDERISLNSELTKTDTVQCSQCQHPLVGIKTCSHCHLPYNPEFQPTLKEEL